MFFQPPRLKLKQQATKQRPDGAKKHRYGALLSSSVIYRGADQAKRIIDLII